MFAFWMPLFAKIYVSTATVGGLSGSVKHSVYNFSAHTLSSIVDKNKFALFQSSQLMHRIVIWRNLLWLSKV